MTAPDLRASWTKAKDDAIGEYERLMRLRIVTGWTEYPAQGTEAAGCAVYVPGSEVRRQLLALRGKVLGCWCTPEPCHGDAIIEAVKRRMEGEAK